VSDADDPTSGPAPDDAATVVHPHAVGVGLSLATALVLLDQLTKQLAEARLTPGRFVPWLGEQVGWQLVYNPGGAFGLSAPHWLFLIVTVGVLVLVARVLPAAPSLAAAVAYGMLLAGAVGNALDRLLRPGGEGFGTGYVVDFVAWGSFPRFNVADSSITVGFVLLVLAVLAEERRLAAAVQAPDAPDQAPGAPDQAPGAPDQAPGAPDQADPGDQGPDDAGSPT
jgi:signal peptidase II